MLLTLSNKDIYLELKILKICGIISISMKCEHILLHPRDSAQALG